MLVNSLKSYMTNPEVFLNPDLLSMIIGNFDIQSDSDLAVVNHMLSNLPDYPGISGSDRDKLLTTIYQSINQDISRKYRFTVISGKLDLLALISNRFEYNYRFYIISDKTSIPILNKTQIFDRLYGFFGNAILNGKLWNIYGPAGELIVYDNSNKSYPIRKILFYQPGNIIEIYSQTKSQNNMYLSDKQWYNSVGLHRCGDPAIVRYNETGKIVEKSWYQNNQLHRDKYPASIEYYSNGKKEIESWFQFNQNYGDSDNPACIRYNTDGTVQHKYWNNEHEVKHRENGPAVLEYYDTGNLYREQYWVQGKLFHPELPASIEYYPSGKVKSRRWVGNLGRHSKDLSSKITYYSTGKIEMEEWLNIDGILDRSNGPAMIEYWENGRIKSRKWYKNGKEIKPGNTVS